MPQTEDLSAEEIFEITKSPVSLAQWLAPRVWGAKAEYRADPWILELERASMEAVSDWDHVRFVKANAPPQSGKSMFDEVFLCMWILGLWPETRIILVGYSDGIAQRSGGMVRDYIKLYGALLFGIEIDPDYGSKGDWKLNGHLGGMLSVGIGSMITGRSGDVIVIGDVIKNMEEANSKSAKDHIWDEFNGSIRPRLQPGGTMFLNATRFADDDPSGRLDAQMAEVGYSGDAWESYVFPAIAEPAWDDPDGDDPEWCDILGRRKGEPLQTRYCTDPNSEPWENSYYYQVRRSVDQYTFSALYQQQPTSLEGSMFDPDNWGWYNCDEERPAYLAQWRTWDLSATEDGGDWSSGCHVAKVSANNEFHVLDMQRFRKAAAEAMAHVQMIAATDGMTCSIGIERERNGAGKALFEFYRLGLTLYTVEPCEPDGKKHERARPASILQQQGKIKLPRHADGSWPVWVPGFIDELKKLMPDGRSGRHDDQIDTFAYAILKMVDQAATMMITPGLVFSGSRGLTLVAS
jgi:hypothetical protein